MMDEIHDLCIDSEDEAVPVLLNSLNPFLSRIANHFPSWCNCGD